MLRVGAQDVIGVVPKIETTYVLAYFFSHIPIILRKRCKQVGKIRNPVQVVNMSVNKARNIQFGNSSQELSPNFFTYFSINSAITARKLKVAIYNVHLVSYYM